MSAMCLLICLVIYFCSCYCWEGQVSTYFVLCFVVVVSYFSLLGGKVMLVGRMKDSSSAGQSMTYISVLEAYICFRGGWEVLGVSKKSVFIILYYCIIPNIFSLIFCSFYVFLPFAFVYVSVFVCLFVH